MRGQVNLAINGSYWIGTAVGSLATLALLDPKLFPIDVGWRVGFFIGALTGFAVLFARRFVPESPRWLTIHGQHDKAVRIVAEIEARVAAISKTPLAEPDDALVIHPHTRIGFRRIARTLLRDYPRRALLGLVLIASQAFLYNAIFFTYALVLTRFYAIPPADTGLYLLPFALGNFAGPLLLGRWFDRLGRRRMIAGTYVISALLLWATGILFARGMLSAGEQTLLWCTIFFFASAAASAAYLTISEIFPLELRALAIALFYAAGTAIGGIAAPWFFGVLIGSGSRDAVSNGYALGAALMLVAAIVEAWLGVDAEGKSLERIAAPLSSRAS
jgi:MFS family permease